VTGDVKHFGGPQQKSVHLEELNCETFWWTTTEICSFGGIKLGGARGRDLSS